MTKILDVWKTLKEKLMTTIQELKVNHKDNWALVKSKSATKKVKILPDHQLEELRSSLLEKKSLLQKMDERKSKELLSPSDQTKYDELSKEITNIQAEINWQELLKKDNWDQLLRDRIAYWHAQQDQAKERASWFTLKEDLIRTNTKIDQLNDKLNWLRTLVRAGDIKQLQELVRSAKI